MKNAITAAIAQLTRRAAYFIFQPDREPPHHLLARLGVYYTPYL